MTILLAPSIDQVLNSEDKKFDFDFLEARNKLNYVNYFRTLDSYVKKNKLDISEEIFDEILNILTLESNGTDLTQEYLDFTFNTKKYNVYCIGLCLALNQDKYETLIKECEKIVGGFFDVDENLFTTLQIAKITSKLDYISDINLEIESMFKSVDQ